MTTADDLLPCPFCGQRARLFPPVWVEDFSVACIHCEAEGPHRRTGPEAIEGWNRRASLAREPQS